MALEALLHGAKEYLLDEDSFLRAIRNRLSGTQQQKYCPLKELAQMMINFIRDAVLSTDTERRITSSMLWPKDYWLNLCTVRLF